MYQDGPGYAAVTNNLKTPVDWISGVYFLLYLCFILESAGTCTWHHSHSGTQAETGSKKEEVTTKTTMDHYHKGEGE